jgi:cation diffusion facilitator family transporter
MQKRTRRGILAAQVGLVVNAVLVVVKIGAGVVGNSYALVADGVESSLDIFSSIITWRGLIVARRAADENYHFGYGKAEAVATASVAVLLLVAAVGISVEAVREMMRPHAPPATVTLFVLVGVVVVKETLFRNIFRVGHDLDSMALRADAWHHRSDAITSAAAFAGIALAVGAGPRFWAADEIAAIFASLIIAFNGIRLLTPAVDDLMDRAPAPDVVAQVRAVAAAIEGVCEVEKVLARRAGIGYFMSLHVQAHPEITLREAHRLGHACKDAIISEVPQVLDVFVHMEPHREGMER